jgi:hypothetical protein
MSRATHWPHIGLYIAISPPLGHHHSFTNIPIYTYLSPQPHTGLDTISDESHQILKKIVYLDMILNKTIPVELQNDANAL